MKEENWNVGSVDGDPASLSNFLAVLVDITDLRLTAKFTTVGAIMLFHQRIIILAVEHSRICDSSIC